MPLLGLKQCFFRGLQALLGYEQWHTENFNGLLGVPRNGRAGLPYLPSTRLPRRSDPNIVAHAQPAGLCKGTLFVNVDSSVWLSEIVRYRRKEILDRLQHSFGREVIARISFRVG